MSVDFYFYKISRSNVGGRADYDDIGHDGFLIRADGNEPAWVKDIATRTEVHNWTVSLFDAGEKMFGRRPAWISMDSHDFTERFHFDDGTSIAIEREQLEPFYYDDVFDAYVFDRELIGRLSSFPCSIDLRDYDMTLIDREAASELLQTYLAENEEDLDGDYAGEYYLRPVYVLVKVLLAAQRGEDVLCEAC